MKLIILLVALSLSLSTLLLLFKSPVFAASPQVVFYVSSTGEDSNSGSLEKPLKTLEKARDVIRTINSNMTEDIIVYLRGGTYTLTSPLTFNQNDSGTNGFNIVYTNYKNERPVISGGKQITGWQQERNKWKVYVGPDLRTRQLFVNGKRAIRARSNGPPISAEFTDVGLSTLDSSIKNWSNIRDIELVMRDIWSEYRCGVENIVNTTFVLKQPCYTIAKSYGTGDINPVWLENAYELLDEPGEWYYNKQSGFLYYIPRQGESIYSAYTIVTVLDKLLMATGTREIPLKNITFQGLSFYYATWLQPDNNEGYPASQSNTIYTDSPDGERKPTVSIAGAYREWVAPPAAVSFFRSQNIRLLENTFAHLGSSGLWIKQGAKRNQIMGNRLFDISGSGIQIGDFHTYNTTDPKELDEENQISNNYITDIANEYHGGTGILLGWAYNNQITHNQLENLPGAGISVGGWARDGSSVSRKNAITYNHIDHAMQEIADQGAIYIPGHQPETIVENNVIRNTGKVHHIGPSIDSQGNVTQNVSFGDGAGIMLDGGPSGITVKENIVTGSAFVNLLITSGKGNIFRDNWWQDRTSMDGKFRCTYYAHSGCRPDVGDTWDGNNPHDNVFENNHKIVFEGDAPRVAIEQAGLQADYKKLKNAPFPSELLGDTVTPSITPTPNSIVTVSPQVTVTSTVVGCPRKVEGDANCDGKIELIDFELYIGEYIGERSTKTADFNGDGMVNIIDFEIWRRNSYR